MTKTKDSDGKNFYQRWQNREKLREIAERFDLTVGEVVDKICLELWKEELRKGRYCDTCIIEIL